MIGAFESTVRLCPQRTCFSYVDEAGDEEAYSYRETRMMAAALASNLSSRGVKPGDSVAVDLPNCPLYVFLILAAAYGGFSLVVLNHRLSDSEKLGRIMEAQRHQGSKPLVRIDADNAAWYLDAAAATITGGSSSARAAACSGRSSGVGFGFGPASASGSGAASAAKPAAKSAARSAAKSASVRPSQHSAYMNYAARTAAASAEARTTRALGRAGSGRASHRRRDEMARQDAVESVIHYAEHASRVFDADARALVMFTSGTTGRAKAVPLTWRNLCGSAEASNAALNRAGEGLWQAALPLYHIGGFQIIIRSLLNGNPFVLYGRFDAGRLLADAVRRNATHVSVVDKMLQDMVASDKADALRRYACVLLGGGALNPQTVERACKLGARVYASYGMTETSSQIAHTQITKSFDGGLRLLPSYRARIVDPGEDGFGRLAVKGPGLFEGYANARAAFTVDGYFLTGDTAALYRDRLYVKERTQDMFVSGGENVYPAEIREKLLRVPGVADAHVFGVPDPQWGRRPVAIVERDARSSNAASVPNSLFAASVRASLSSRLSKLYQPKHLLAVGGFPRTGIGKTDRAALESLYDQRLEVRRITLYRIRLPFKVPFETSKGTLRERESVLVEVVDHAGRTGLGECVAFPTDWYLPETLDQDVSFIRDALAPVVLREAFLHPRDVSGAFSAYPKAALLPMACGAVESAMWDLYGKIVEKPLWQLIGGTQPAASQGSSASVPAGAVVGIASPVETAAAARRCAEEGYKRVKLKVRPGTALACTRAVRAALPDMVVTLDANQSFTERDVDELRALDELGVAWIEEPLDPRRPPATGPHDIFERLARLQRTMRTPLCLDESITRPGDITRALSHPELSCYAVKIAKFGGVQPALDFIERARERGIGVWMGGMYDTGVSKRLHAAFETLACVDGPGDIGSTSRYFPCDVTDPPYTAERGTVTINRGMHAHGLGCDLNRSVLANVLIDRIVIP